MVNLWIFIVPITFSAVAGELSVLYEWKYIDYVWENSQQKQDAIDSGNYSLDMLFFVDLDQAPDGRTFVTSGRYPGVPVALSTVSDEHGEGGPLLKPYPDWSWHRSNNCSGIISVFRVEIVCNHIFVLDSGRANGAFEQICPAQVMIFDLTTDKLVKRVTIPSNYSQDRNGSGVLVYLAVGVPENCHNFLDNFQLYIADTVGFGLLTYDGQNMKRFEDETFDMEPDKTEVEIRGQMVVLEYGIHALALRTSSDPPILFYRPIASFSQYKVSVTDILEAPDRSDSVNYTKLPYTSSTQMDVEVISSDGIMFMGYLDPPSIACWNSYKEMNDENVVIVAADDSLQYITGMKLKHRELLLLSSAMHKVFAGKVDHTVINYQIFREMNIENLVAGTNCQL